MLAYCLSRSYGDYLYMSYFAVDQKFRSKGIGSAFVQELAKTYPSKIILVDIEKVTEPNNKTDLKTKRADFYFKNGFEYSSISSRISGVDYSVMMLGRQPKQFL